jgi:hypothetical protein
MTQVTNHLLKTLKFTGTQLLLLLTPIIITSAIQQEALPEYHVKAIFLYNFAQFIEWPSDAFPHADAPLIIGVLGDDPFGPYLDEATKNERVNNHPLSVRRFRNLNEIDECHILFISTSEKDKIKDICRKLVSTNTLTVGDSPNFTKQGGMIRFYSEENKTRIRINLIATKNAELTISSKLLRLADIVNHPVK